MEIKRIAHRGFSSEAPENTRASFSLAVEGDFFGIECDIWKCLDGTYVVSHDGHLERMCGVDKWIPQMTYAEVSSYPVIRGKKRTEHPVQHLIRFSEYLSILARSDKMHPVVELKMDYTVVELREIVDLVKKYGLYDRTYFISMYQSALLNLKDELGFPADRLQYVYGVPRPSKTIPVNAQLEHWLIQHRINLDSRYTLVSPGTIMRLHEENIQVNVWTVNRRQDMERLVKMGVDMVTTEYYFQ